MGFLYQNNEGVWQTDFDRQNDISFEDMLSELAEKLRSEGVEERDILKVVASERRKAHEDYLRISQTES